ncbi:hypothetical protein [Flavobacterium chungangense]|uniref:Uncharacterized protein n=1 Tax=Flavobacterium chungangense TaxID=554283 RepID=A0A6V6YRM4_9FLAO|nr:hypothetical protein [Flavobacterium chungangense]CAD0002093.1 hypothetical protein FLACHUCJ7_00821 [Flavobacterium chungangense]
MKNAILILILLFILPSCKENNNTKTTKMSNLTSKNYIETMMNNIKYYDDEPLYQLVIKNSWCSSEILVNDIPVFKNFQEPLIEPTVDINHYIFKSGTQKITIRMYPVGKYQDENIDSFIAETGISVSVITFHKKTDKDIEIIKYTTPKKEGRNNPFVAIGKTYYEASFTFEAKVPYEFTSLDKGQDLRNWNQEKLEQKVVDFYKNQFILLKEKKIEEYFSYLELKEKETCQSLFYRKKELEEILKAYLDAFKIPHYQIQPLENYKLKIYGDGRIVCLEIESLDNNLRGESALWAKFDEGDGMVADFLQYYLYIPEGEDELVILR